MRDSQQVRRTGQKTANGAVVRGLSLVVLICLTGAAGARQTPSGLPPIGPEPGPAGTNIGPSKSDPDPFAKARSEGAQRSIATDRQRRLLADADKLVALSNELKAEVDKSTKNDLSLTVVRKAAEIEKLAHDVKERERN